MTYKKLLAAAGTAVVITTVALGLVATVSAADKYEVIYKLSGLAGGAGPTGALISDAAGNLYGTASYDGANGVVFKLSHEASGRWRETVLHSFQVKDGATPTGDLVIDKAGNLYGTTSGGGGHNSGLVFKLAPDTNNEWSESVLHDFQGTDGAAPNGGLIFDRAGNLYGTTSVGGAHNNGAVFKLSPDADGEWSETVLHSFQGSPDGAYPGAGLIFDRAGNLYGTTQFGGSFGGNGTVFKLSPEPNGEWTETVLHDFQGTEGARPQARLTFDRAGNLYGTTLAGGVVPGLGVVFKLSPELNRRWIETVLHSFQGSPDGANPMGALIIYASGNLYGTTFGGGNSVNCILDGCGTVFRLTH